MSNMKFYKPTTPGRRGMSSLARKDVDKKSFIPNSLVGKIKNNAGRNNTGRITVRHRGGGQKRKYRIVDFHRSSEGKFDVVSIQYDPNRTANIALLKSKDSKLSYVIAPINVKKGDILEVGENADIISGNHKMLEQIPVGTLIYNIEIYPGHGGQFVRSAGTCAQLIAKEGRYALIRLPSGEVRKFHLNCTASIGQVGNQDNSNVNLGKAGRRRHMGWRPCVRGVVMNPNDHPHGGGEGKSPVGRPGPVSPWGKPTLGYKTRKKTKKSNRLIIKRRGK